MQYLVPRAALQLVNTCQLASPSTTSIAFRCLTQAAYSAATDRRYQSVSGLSFTVPLSHIRSYADVSYAQAAKDLNQKGLDHQESQFNDAIAQEKEKQTRTPWHREGSQVPPVKRQRSAGAMTKGKVGVCKLLAWLINLHRF